MNKEKEKYLVEAYPELYKNYFKSKYESPMSRGFECGDGWFDLINKLSMWIKNNTNKNPHMFPQVEVCQVKEKFGELSYYASVFSENNKNLKVGADKVLGAISFARYLSAFICEKCGRFDSSGTTKLKNSWIHNACDDCWEKQNI